MNLISESEMASEEGGIVTHMRALVNRFLGRATDPAWAEFDRVGDSFALPREWIVCPNCGAQSWRLPPHGFDPCPIVVAMAETAGMKFDAERSSAVRLGVHMEEMTRAVRRMTEDEEEDE